MEDRSYIYRTTNNINQKEYVGISTFRPPLHPLDDNYWGSNGHLQNSIKLYGEENFTKKILVIGPRLYCSDIEAIIVDEEYVERDDTYNIRTGGDNGFTMSPEARANISKAQMGRKLSDEARANMSAAQNLPEVKARRSAALKVYYSIPENKAKASASHKGKKFSDEHKASLSAASKNTVNIIYLDTMEPGRILTEEFYKLKAEGKVVHAKSKVAKELMQKAIKLGLRHPTKRHWIGPRKYS